MNATLERFFVEMQAFLSGETDAIALVERLGPSRSGATRMALYPTLVERQWVDVLEALFPAVKAGCALLAPDPWHGLIHQFVRAYPPRHWEPNHFGEPFASFLTERREAEQLPLWLEELADYAWIRFAAAIAELGPDDDGVGLDRSLFVRRYTYDVVSFTRAVVPGSGARSPQAAPRPFARTVLIGWSRDSREVVVVDASVAALVAIGRRAKGSPLGDRSISGLSEDDVLAAEKRLIGWGLVARLGP